MLVSHLGHRLLWSGSLVVSTRLAVQVQVFGSRTNVGRFFVSVFKKYPFHELECPGGLQEVEFLKLLRSTLPPLAFDKPFEFFITDRTKRLFPLRVDSFTPEQVSKAAGNSALYIRLKVRLPALRTTKACLRRSSFVLVFQCPQDFPAGQDRDQDAPDVQAGPSTR